MGALDVCVVGSANLDITVAVDALPQPGETRIGGDATRAIGGKGLNQAIACARLGRRTALLACTGTDDAGGLIEAGLVRAGVEAHTVVRRDTAPTGLALVLVGPDDNAIVVSPGANSLLAPADVRAVAATVGGARAVLAQLEIPLDTVLAAAGIAEGLFLLNPAPGRPLPPALLDRVDVLVPNAVELAALAGRERCGSIEDAAALARMVHPGGQVVVTLGSDGALVVDGERTVHVAPVRTEVVDPTAAGDTFCAALADALLDGADLVEAARWACRAAAVTVGRHGAANAVPTRDEVLRSGQ